MRPLSARHPRVQRLARLGGGREGRVGGRAGQGGLDAMRPDLDGTQIMEVLGIGPGPDVGQAYRFLLERRLDEGPLGEARAREELLAWWGARP